MSPSTSTFSPSCSFKTFKRTWGAMWKVLRFHIPRSMFWSILHECIHCQLNSVQPKQSPHAIRKVELLAARLVCHLVGITNRGHLMHAFIEHSGKTFDCMSLTCIFIADITKHKILLQPSLHMSWSPSSAALVKKSIPCRMQRALGIPPLDLWIISPWTCHRLDTSFLPKSAKGKKRTSASLRNRAQPNSARYFS